MKLLILAFAAFFVSSCSSNKVIVKKDTCKDIYDGVLMECERVKK